MKNKVVVLCRDMKTHNVGQYLANGGLIVAGIGIISAMIGNRIRISTFDDTVLIGEKELADVFWNVVNNVKESRLGLFLFRRFCKSYYGEEEICERACEV